MSTYNRKLIWTIVISACIIMIALVWGITARKPSPEELQFQTIEQFDQASGLPNESREPGLIVITSMQEIENLDGMINKDAKAKLQIMDYSKHFVIYVFQGYKPTLGYGVNITKITRLQNNVTIFADFTEQRQDIEAATLVSFPYHLVQVEKTGNWNLDITFDLNVDQVNIVSVSHFMP